MPTDEQIEQAHKAVKAAAELCQQAAEQLAGDPEEEKRDTDMNARIREGAK